MKRPITTRLKTVKDKLLLSGLSLALLGGAGCEQIDDLVPDKDKDKKATMFQVRVENVSQPNTLEVDRLNGVVPLSPGVFAVYPKVNPLFLPGTPADEGTENIAEDGFPMKEAQSLKDNPLVQMSGIFKSPGGPGDTPALAPGEYATFTIKAKPGDQLNIETMFVQSNDWFYGFGDHGLDLFHGTTPISGDVTKHLVLYDAGTEEDSAPGTGPFQKPVQPGPDTGPADPYELIAPARDRHPEFMIPENDSVIKVTITPQGHK
jgi:hypothetical protein